MIRANSRRVVAKHARAAKVRWSHARGRPAPHRNSFPVETAEDHSVFRIGLGAKFGLFAFVLALLPLFLVYGVLLPGSSKIVNDHEIGDLKDETLLRGREVVESVHLLREDTLRLAHAFEVRALLRERANPQEVTAEELQETQAHLGKIFTEVLQDKNNPKPDPIEGEIIKDCKYLSVLVLDGISGELIVSRHWDAPTKKVAEFAQNPRGVPSLVEGARAFYQSLKDGELPGTEDDNPDAWPEVYLSPIELVRTAGQEDQMILSGVVPVYGKEREVPALLVVIEADLGPMLRWVSRSPRHFVYVTDEQGKLLLTPETNGREPAKSQPSAAVKQLFQLPEFADLNLQRYYPSQTAHPVPLPELGKTLGNSSEEDQRIKLTPPLYLLRSTLCKVDDEYLKAERDLDRVRLRKTLEVKMAEDPTLYALREVRADMPYLYLRGQTEQQVRDLEIKLHSEFPTLLQEDTVVVPCRTVAAHFVPLQLARKQSERFLGLVVAASYEELAHDISEEFNSVKIWAIVYTGVAAAVAWLLARRLTRPLEQITDATTGFAEGEFDVALPAQAPDEIGKLARAFQEMIRQVRARGEELKESEVRIRAILSTAADGILTIDDRGKIESINRAAERIFGYSSEELLGDRVTKLIVFDDDVDFDSRQSSILGVELGKLIGQSRELVGLRHDGSTFPLELAVSEVPLGMRQFYTVILRDVTERKRDEAQIKMLNAELEKRVRERTAELEKTNGELILARDAALEAGRAKDAFLANMSHELRTPLTAIIGYSEMLQEEAEDIGRDEFVQDLQKILSSGKHLLDLINDILDDSAISAGKVKFDLGDFPVKRLIQEVAEVMEPLVKKNDNHLELDCPDDLGTMHSDRKRVRQVLFNLLSNSCKFTQNGRITLRATRAKQDADVDQLTFSVSDTGCGMNHEQLDKLFQRFNTSGKGGTGLGLSISRGVCQLMGGDIEVESEVEKGSTFTVHLPVRTELRGRIVAAQGPFEKGNARPEPVLPHRAHRSNMVLVIDDDPAVRDLMQRFLTKEGFPCRTAANGEEGLRVAKQFLPAVITLDAVMPGIDGWGVLAALKADEATKDIPIIMVTMVDDKSKGFSLGATDYITKPVNWDRLSQLLDRYEPESPPGPILVVEDDPTIREMVGKKLKKAGWEVIEAANGREGLERLGSSQPCLILLDLLMPQMDGFEFVQELRTHPQWKLIPVIVVTAIDLTEEQRLRLNGSVEQILQKGAYSRQELLAEISQQVALYVHEHHEHDAGP